MKEHTGNAVAWIGIDWADERHEICEYRVASGEKRIYSVRHGSESLQDWMIPSRFFEMIASSAESTMAAR